jgi:UDP-glucose 4-epimerase
MKIFITGIAGFLGSHLAEYFINQGHKVSGVDNLLGGDRSNVPEGVNFYLGDCSVVSLMNNIFEEETPDVVFHLACYPHEGLSVFAPATIAGSVFNASMATFSASVNNGVKRIVFASSMSRYGNGMSLQSAPFEKSFRGAPFEEWYTPHPQDPYAVAKVASEQVLKQLCETNGVEHIIAVPHNIIGTRQCFDDPYRNVASIFLNRMKQGLPPIIYGDGTQTRCFSPIEDCIDCLAEMANLERKDLDGEVINIGPGDEGITVKELAKLCEEAVGGIQASRSTLPIPDNFRIGDDGFLYTLDRPREVKHASCSDRKARRLLGYEPKGDLRACVKAMASLIPEGGKSFNYDRYSLEILNDKTPTTWAKKLM